MNLDKIYEELSYYNENFDIDRYPDATDRQIAEDFLVSGECDLFAYILHEMTQYPIYTFSFSNNKGFGHHSVVKVGNKFMDAKGLFSDKEIMLRYGYKSLETAIEPASESNHYGFEHSDDLENLFKDYIREHPILKQHIKNKPEQVFEI